MKSAAKEFEDSRYFGDVLANWQNGVQLDLRAKLAIEFLKGGLLARFPVAGVESLENVYAPERAAAMARFALDVATAYVDECEKRGLSKALPDTDQLSGAHRLHIRRQTRAGIFQQVVAQEIGRDESPSVVPSGNGLPGRLV